MNVSQYLKESTRKVHQEVEKKVVLRIKAIRSNKEYIELLKYFYSYFNAVERAAAPYINKTIMPDFSKRRDASYLRNDIESLGGSTELLPPSNPPLMSDSLEAMSALYVLEGSVIGGPYIVAMLSKIGITEGISFFSGYGSETEQRWEKFTKNLDDLVQVTRDKERSLNIALQTFRQFGEIFEQKIHTG